VEVHCLAQRPWAGPLCVYVCVYVCDGLRGWLNGVAFRNRWTHNICRKYTHMIDLGAGLGQRLEFPYKDSRWDW
jgi:hypothetical protein